jgi:hypothetical protein
MAQTFAHVFAHRAPAAPQGAFVKTASTKLARFGQWLLRECEIIGERRARQHLERLAIQFDHTSPDLALKMRQTMR